MTDAHGVPIDHAAVVDHLLGLAPSEAQAEVSSRNLAQPAILNLPLITAYMPCLLTIRGSEDDILQHQLIVEHFLCVCLCSDI